MSLDSAVVMMEWQKKRSFIMIAIKFPQTEFHELGFPNEVVLKYTNDDHTNPSQFVLQVVRDLIMLEGSNALDNSEQCGMSVNQIGHIPAWKQVCFLNPGDTMVIHGYTWLYRISLDIPQWVDF